jgi:hypothetical protein
VIKKPREIGDHSPRWAAEPEKIMIIVDYFPRLFFLKVFIAASF